MPFTRFITSCFLLVFLLMALVGPGDHPWFTDGTLLLAVMFAICVWLMSLKRAFFLDVMAILFSLFFLQRIVVIYFRPDEMSYQEGHLIFSSQVFNEAILYCTAISVAVLIGYLFAIYIRKQEQKNITINYNRLFGIGYDFDLLFKVYALFLVASFIFEVYLMVGLTVGITSIDFDRQYAPLLRIVQIVQVLHFLPILVLASGKFSSGTRKIAFFLLILFLARLVFLTASKAAILYLCVASIVCLYFCGKQISKKYLIIGFILFLFTIFVLAPGVTLLRAGFQGLAAGSMNINDVPYMMIDNYVLKTDQLFFGFMNRMGIFDWVVGFMAVGRDAFLPSASIYNDLILIINSLVPGDLIDMSPDYVTISKLMPHILRGWDLGSYPGHSENMGGAGMAYLYFGKIGGVLFFFIWSFISAKILNSNTSVILKVLFFTYFVFNLFLGGDLTTSVRLFYDGLLMLIVIIFVSELTLPKAYKRFPNTEEASGESILATDNQSLIN